MWELELSLMQLEEMVQKKWKLLSKKIHPFLAKKNSAAWTWKALYLVEFTTYCGRNFIPVWDESIEPCSQYASSCPGEIKEIRDKINSTIRQTVGQWARREEKRGKAWRKGTTVGIRNNIFWRKKKNSKTRKHRNIPSSR